MTTIIPDDPDSASTESAAAAASTAASTGEAILDAAIRILARDGYQSLTARRVAEEAGTNLALINYYFGGKQGMLLAIYDRLERQRFERQAQMYGSEDEPLSAKWRRAIEFYRNDVAEGFVRVHHELMVQGFANPQLAERARERIRTWNELLIAVAEEYLTELGIQIPPRLLVTALGAFWYGMEQHHLIGMTEDETPYFEILEQIGRWLEEREQAAESRD